MLLNDGVTAEVPQLPAPPFVPVEAANTVAPARPEPLGPGVVEVVSPAGHRIRLAPPIRYE